MGDQQLLDFDGTYGMDAPARDDRPGTSAENGRAVPAENEEGQESEGFPTDWEERREARACRMVETFRERRRAARHNYAKMGAARLAARIQLTMPPGDSVHPGQNVEVTVVESRKVSSPVGPPRTYRTYGVCTSASEQVCRWARSIDRHDDPHPIREKAFLWALIEWHRERWVQARRLFAAAREPRWSKHALLEWEASAVLEVLEERSRPDSRPDGRPPQAPGKAPGKLEEPQEMALAEVYRLEELVEKKLVEEGAAEDEILDEIRGLGGPEKPCGSGSGPVERSIAGLRGQIRDLNSGEIEDLKTHLKGEEVAKQLLARGVDLAREAKRREELRAKVRETTETALEKTRQRLQGGERVEAARVLREAQATLNGLANEAPKFLGPEVEKRLERRLKESLGEPDYRELRRGLAEADVEDGRAERGDPEAARALSGPQREAAGSLEKAARFATIPESGAERKSNLREAAQAMAGMSEEDRSQIRRAVSSEAQEAFKTAQRRAEELRSDRSEKTKQKSRKTQSQKSQSRSRGRG